MNLREVLSNIQTELKAKKGQTNAFGKYSYRSAEDVLEGNLFAIDNTADADALNKHGNEAPKKELLTESSSSYVKVITALKAGSATIEQVQSKFNVTPELLTKLKSI